MPDLKHYAALVARCALYIGGDTGPMHVAAAMGTPVIAIFGGTNPAQHAPCSTAGRVAVCRRNERAERGRARGCASALRRIAPDDVYEACISQLFAVDEIHTSEKG